MNQIDYTPLLGFFVITIIIFLVCREIVCWYWKQNEQVALLKEIRDLLKANTVPSVVEAQATRVEDQVSEVLAEPIKEPEQPPLVRCALCSHKAPGNELREFEGTMVCLDCYKIKNPGDEKWQPRRPAAGT